MRFLDDLAVARLAEISDLPDLSSTKYRLVRRLARETEDVLGEVEETSMQFFDSMERMEEAPSAGPPDAPLPNLDIEGAKVRIIMGAAYGEISPVQTFSETLYLDCTIPGSGALTLPTGQEELALYVATGSIEIANETFGAGVMAVAGVRETISIKAREDSRVVVIGGANIGSRHINWNFVSGFN